MTDSILACANLYEFGTDLDVFQIGPLVQKVLFKALQKGRQGVLGQLHDHLVVFHQENGPMSLAKEANLLVLVLLYQLLVEVVEILIHLLLHIA